MLKSFAAEFVSVSDCVWDISEILLPREIDSCNSRVNSK